MTTLTIGCAIRRPLRRWLQQQNIAFKEDKGWLNSQFVFGPITPHQRDILLDWARRVNAE